ncbi:2-amino-4-hydroxy-6-hydroxymethyldihydropteridine diphosphokinase [Pseudidiomarina aestuarii]|uniref:2-amino-4-hydroxy-6-hydroxymethyldihydropteridine diphosphokinase n=1 Tax=Pseudidiomarina aestuarii TaxID=624146 RepID=A0A7Z6ZSW5_9GAMM|nr:2-amino-4-hydroxy-6-hydroxymethyldihydropteridine diphosphokinase [Pseudidiomarina aestuarii]RUO40666.1 2-amino-4-hydroxy-6-hydroxymethyldihydropteridine diphosphokinase [Pseudidiomarina aestuarii]
MPIVALGIGSNKQRRYHIGAGIEGIVKAFGTVDTPIYCSRVFESDAVGFAGQPFYNLVVAFESDMTCQALQTVCKSLESQHGHNSDAPRFSPRTLDIDILIYGSLIQAGPVQVPRDEIVTNAFVLWPLSEVLPNFVHPLDQQTFAELWQNYHSAQQLHPIEFQFPSIPHLRQGQAL